MAQTPRSKRLSTQEKPKAAASSSEDEVGSGKESSESGCSVAAEKKQSKKPPQAKKPQPSSESDRPPQVVSKPIASEPVDDGSKLKKKARDVPSTPTTKSTGKRPAENTGGESSSKRPLFQRLWNEGDVIVILEGLADLVKKGVADPPSDVDTFLTSIQQSLSIVVENSQLSEKIRKLKRKYLNNTIRSGKTAPTGLFQNLTN